MLTYRVFVFCEFLGSGLYMSFIALKMSSHQRLKDRPRSLEVSSFLFTFCSRVHQNLPDFRGMGIIDRPIGCLPSHLHPPNSRKYLSFCHRSQVFQLTFLPFGLATAPQVFTVIVKEVKLMALTRGLRLHQYLDDWLIRSQSQEEAQVNTQAVVDLTQCLGWIINQEKSELKPTQVF